MSLSSARQVSSACSGQAKEDRRGFGAKVVVFSLFKRNGKVYTEIVPEVKAKTLQGIIQKGISLDSIVRSSKWAGYGGLGDVRYERRFCVDPGKGAYVRGDTRINGIFTQAPPPAAAMA